MEASGEGETEPRVLIFAWRVGKGVMEEEAFKLSLNAGVGDV